MSSHRSEKERQNLVVEIDVVSSELEQTRQGNMAAASRADGLEGQMARLKAQVRTYPRNLWQQNQSPKGHSIKK